MKRLLIGGMIAMVAVSLLFIGCKKESETEADLTSAEDQSSGELNYDLIFKQVDLAANDKGLKKGAYPIVTIDTSVSPRTMSIYYGLTNYLCLDGNYRRGTINVSWTGRYRADGTVISISFDKFYQNDNLVEGTKTVTNVGRNTSGLMVFTIVVNGKITNTSGISHTWNSNRTRTWIEGEGTAIVSDDIYEVTGTTSGVNRNGLSYTSTITEKLRVDLGCEWRITSGVIEVTPSGKTMRKVDFGNGACDKLITVTVNGKTKAFERRK